MEKYWNLKREYGDLMTAFDDVTKASDQSRSFQVLGDVTMLCSRGSAKTVEKNTARRVKIL